VVGLAFVAAVESAVVVQPRHRAFDHPAMPAQSPAGLDAAAGDTRWDPASAQPHAETVVVIALVGVRLSRSAATRPTPGGDRRDAPHQRHQRLTLVAAEIPTQISSPPRSTIRRIFDEPFEQLPQLIGNQTVHH
jgi:hypothetical protein